MGHEPHADLLLYGCDVARTENGEVFINALSILTEADVAASAILPERGVGWRLAPGVPTRNHFLRDGVIDALSDDLEFALAVTAEDPL